MRRKLSLFHTAIPLVAVLAGAPSLADTIHDAAESGDLAQIQRMVVDGADVNAKGINDETPLIVASLAGQGEIATYLLQRGANIDARNAKGMKAIHAAAFGGHRDIVVLLLAKGADLSDADNFFRSTPLHLAAEQNHSSIVDLLLKRGADPNSLERHGYKALTRASWKDNWEIVDMLLAAGATCQEADLVGPETHQMCTARAAKQ